MARIRRPRYRQHRRKSRRLAAFLSSMSSKFDGQQTPINVTAVGTDVAALDATPDAAGPWVLVGATPPELRDVPRFWLSVDGSDNATLYQTRSDLAGDESPVDLASWDLAPTFATLSGVTLVVATSASGGTIATLTTADTVAVDTTGATFTDVEINAGTEEITVTGHGYVTGDGPIQVTTSDALPTGISAATNYYIIRVDDNTIKIASTLANAIGGTPVDIAADGSGTHTIHDRGVDITLDCFFSKAHGFSTGDGPYRATTSGALPDGLLVATNYWLRAVDADRYAFATTKADALDNNLVDLLDNGTGNHTVSLSAVDTTLETLRKAGHGFDTGDGPIRLSTDGALPTGLTADTDYWTIKVDDDLFSLADSLVNAQAETAINLTAIGSGTTTIAILNVDLTLETLKSVAHGFVTEDGPVRLTTSGALPTGLSAATDYWLIATDADHVAFATTQANALAGTKVNLTAIGSGNTTITLSDVDVGDENAHVIAHGMQSGDGPFQLTTSGTLPTGLTLATDYWAIRVNADHLKFATTFNNAIAGTAVDLTGVGSGTHTIARDLTIQKDLSDAGILEWMAQGISIDLMKSSDASDADTIFV